MNTRIDYIEMTKEVCWELLGMRDQQTFIYDCQKKGSSESEIMMIMRGECKS
jgi:hypothetical protein